MGLRLLELDLLNIFQPNGSTAHSSKMVPLSWKYMDVASGGGVSLQVLDSIVHVYKWGIDVVSALYPKCTTRQSLVHFFTIFRILNIAKRDGGRLELGKR